MAERAEPPELPPAPDDLANFWGRSQAYQTTEEDVIEAAEELQAVSLERQASAASSDNSGGQGGGSERLHGSSDALFAGQEEVRCVDRSVIRSNAVTVACWCRFCRMQTPSTHNAA